MYTYTQNRILHHEDCPAGSLYPWKWLSLVGNEVSFEKLLPSCWRSREWLCNLVLWPRLISVLLTNQIDFLDMFCWFNVILKNKKISYFSENCCMILCDGSFNTLYYTLACIHVLGQNKLVEPLPARCPKSTQRPKRNFFPCLMGVEINFPSILFKIVHVCFQQNFINQTSGKSSLVLCKKILLKKGHK